MAQWAETTMTTPILHERDDTELLKEIARRIHNDENITGLTLRRDLKLRERVLELCQR